MPKFLKSLVIFLALPLVLAGCKINSINYFPPTPAHFRVVNVLGTTTPINVIANGVTIWSGLNFEAMTDYVEIENVTTKFQITFAGSDVVIVEQTYNPAGNQNYTLVVYGTPQVPLLGVMADTTQAPQSGKFALNVFNAAPIGNGSAIGTISVDMYMITPGQVIDGLTPSIYVHSLHRQQHLRRFLVRPIPVDPDRRGDQVDRLRLRPAHVRRTRRRRTSSCIRAAAKPCPTFCSTTATARDSR